MEPLSWLYCSINGFNSVSLYLIGLICILLIISAFFSSSEMAYSSANIIRMRNYVEEKTKGSHKALYLCENYEKTLATILVANNLLNIASTTIAAYLFSSLIINPSLANVMNTLVMTLIILIFGEILPKSLAKISPEKFALKFSAIMFVAVKVLYPVTFLFIKFQKSIIKKAKRNKQKMPTVTENELETIIDTMEEEGVIKSQDASLIQGVLDLGDTTAYDIMTPRVDVHAIEINDSQEVIMNTFTKYNHTRLPVYKDDIDHIVGVINQKDFYPLIISNKKFDINKIITEPLYLSESIKVDEIIRKMQKEKTHLSIVLDEHGGTSGIVCLEDALEEMVGEIYDEHDSVDLNDKIIKISDTEYLLDAEIDIEELFELLKIENMPNSEYSSLGGFLYEMSDSLPHQNQEIVFDTIDEYLDKMGNLVEKAIKMHFTLVKVREKRIRQVKLVIDYGKH